MLTAENLLVNSSFSIQTIRIHEKFIYETWCQQISSLPKHEYHCARPTLIDDFPRFIQSLCRGLEDPGCDEWASASVTIAQRHRARRLDGQEVELHHLLLEYQMLRDVILIFLKKSFVDAGQEAQFIHVIDMGIRKVVESFLSEVKRDETNTQQQFKKAMDEIERNRALLAELIDQMPVGVSLRESGTYKLILQNKEADRLLGVLNSPAQQSVGLLSGALHPNGKFYRAEEYPTIRALMTGEVVADEAILYRRADQSEIFLSVCSRPIRDARGQVFAAVSTFVNQSELSLQNRELERFAAIAAHDLKSPLNTIAQFIEVLGEKAHGKLGEEGDLYIQSIVRNGNRMRQLIDKLLQYAKAGYGIDDRKAVDCRVVCEEAIANLQTTARQCQAKIEVGPLPVLSGDEVSLLQVFQNLIANALKFRRPDTAPEILITASENSHEWVFTVSDNGPGIAEKDQDCIFEFSKRLRHFQKIEGAGLGLAICRRIIEAHGGRIWLESKPNAGSKFLFTLPKSQ